MAVGEGLAFLSWVIGRCFCAVGLAKWQIFAFLCKKQRCQDRGMLLRPVPVCRGNIPSSIET